MSARRRIGTQTAATMSTRVAQFMITIKLPRRKEKQCTRRTKVSCVPISDDCLNACVTARSLAEFPASVLTSGSTQYPWIFRRRKTSNFYADYAPHSVGGTKYRTLLSGFKCVL